MNREKDEYGRSWILENTEKVLADYSEGITLRQLYYRLVTLGMTNDNNHYKRVVQAMVVARWNGIVDFESFIDRERSMYGNTKAEEKNVEDEIEDAKDTIKLWMRAYGLERWSNQDKYIEVWIEKKALQGVFEMPCYRAGVGLAPCKGYPSLTFLNDAYNRYQDVEDKEIIILYFGDHDPSGDNIPESLQKNLSKLGVDVEVKRIALTENQIEEMGLPGVPPKATDTRTATWSGSVAVECDAIEPRMLAKMCEDAIEEHFDGDLYAELNEREAEEREIYQKKLKEFVRDMDIEED